MCGICGTVGKFDPWRKRMLVYANRSRGVGGFGAAYIEDGEWQTVKAAEDVKKSLQDPEFDGIFNSDVLVCHTRAPSAGLGAGSSVILANTHPFISGNTVVAHNGRVRNDKELAKANLDGEKFTVDSDVLCRMIEKFGLEEAVGTVQGTAGLWYIDKENTDEFWLWCWDQDLAIWIGDEGIAFSSEVEHLVACGWNNSNGRVGELKRDGQLITIDLKTKLPTNKKVVGFTPEPKKVKTYPAKTTTSNSNTGGGSVGYHKDDMKVGQRIVTFVDKSKKGVSKAKYGVIVETCELDYSAAIVFDNSSSEPVWLSQSIIYNTEVEKKKEDKADKKDEPLCKDGEIFQSAALHRILNSRLVTHCSACRSLVKRGTKCVICGAESAKIIYAKETALTSCHDCGWLGSGSPHSDGNRCPICGKAIDIVPRTCTSELMTAFIRFYNADREKGNVAWSSDEYDALCSMTEKEKDKYREVRADWFKVKKKGSK